MRRTRGALVALFIPLAASACHLGIEPTYCDLSLRFSVEVMVIDSVTGAPPATATLLVRNGTFVDSIGPSQPGVVSLTDPPALQLLSVGGAGSYDLVVRSPGYRDWTQSGVEVTKGRCGPNLTKVTARLQR